MNQLEIHQAASVFVGRCHVCRLGDGEGRCDHRVGPATNVELVEAWAGYAQARPSSRHYAARIAVREGFERHDRSDSSWWQTWQGLCESCPEFSQK
jgi:hypothetical protein